MSDIRDQAIRALTAVGDVVRDNVVTPVVNKVIKPAVFYDETMRATEEAGLTGPVGGAEDAFRHMYLMAKNAQRYGPAVAKTIGGIHEAIGMVSAPNADTWAQTKMDLHNNMIGADLGREGLSDAELKAKIRAKALRAMVTPSMPVEHLLRTPPIAAKQWTASVLATPAEERAMQMPETAARGRTQRARR